MHQAFLFEAVGNACFAQQFDESRFEHAGANALQDVCLRVLFDHNVIDANSM